MEGREEFFGDRGKVVVISEEGWTGGWIDGLVWRKEVCIASGSGSHEFLGRDGVL